MSVPAKWKGKKVSCDYCGGPAPLIDSVEIYQYTSYGLVYYCEKCGAWVGVHKGTCKPLGRLANAELRRAKMETHRFFDPIWKNPRMLGYMGSRNNAYAWLARKLGIPRSECHIGMMDVETCRRAVEFCKQKTGQR